VAVLVKWFPDRRGLITGIAVGGFGAGALITAPVATRLIQSVGVLNTFAYLGIAYLIVTIISGSFMQNPPDGWKPESWSPTARETSERAGHDFVLSEALRTWPVVGALAVVVSHLRRHFGHLAGGTDFSGTN
jgi:OFA family oxalate/formate antiporter-like MFS transporter